MIRRDCPALLRRIRRLTLVVPLLSLLVAAHPGRADAQWRVEAWFGDAWSAKVPLVLSQDGEPDIRVTPRWKTHPYAPTWYFAGRIAKWSGDEAWAFEYMHHKLYLENPPQPEVAYFRITNGINNLLGEHLWRRHGWEFGAGAGPAFVVPISKVRDKVYTKYHGVFESVYEWGGATLQGNLARRVKLLPFTYGTLSIKATATWLRVNIADGHARTVNLAAHLQYGLSLQSKK